MSPLIGGIDIYICILGPLNSLPIDHVKNNCMKRPNVLHLYFILLLVTFCDCSLFVR